MSIDPSLVTEIAPQFTDETRIALMLARAERRHTPAPWGAVYEDAMVLYAAHMLTRFPATAAASEAAAESAGEVTSRGAGDLSEAYASAGGDSRTGADADLLTTRYGRDYLALRASRVAGAPTTINVYEG